MWTLRTILSVPAAAHAVNPTPAVMPSCKQRLRNSPRKVWQARE